MQTVAAGRATVDPRRSPSPMRINPLMARLRSCLARPTQRASISPRHSHHRGAGAVGHARAHRLLHPGVHLARESERPPISQPPQETTPPPRPTRTSSSTTFCGRSSLARRSTNNRVLCGAATSLSCPRCSAATWRHSMGRVSTGSGTQPVTSRASTRIMTMSRTTAPWSPDQ